MPTKKPKLAAVPTSAPLPKWGVTDRTRDPRRHAAAKPTSAPCKEETKEEEEEEEETPLPSLRTSPTVQSTSTPCTPPWRTRTLPVAEVDEHGHLRESAKAACSVAASTALAAVAANAVKAAAEVWWNATLAAPQPPVTPPPPPSAPPPPPGPPTADAHRPAPLRGPPPAHMAQHAMNNRRIEAKHKHQPKVLLPRVPHVPRVILPPMAKPSLIGPPPPPRDVTKAGSGKGLPKQPDPLEAKWYAKAGKGGMRKGEAYRNRSKGDNGPRFGNRGMVDNPNVVWHTARAFAQRQSVLMGPGFMAQWYHANPKPLNKEEREEAESDDPGGGGGGGGGGSSPDPSAACSAAAPLQRGSDAATSVVAAATLECDSATAPSVVAAAPIDSSSS